MQFCKELQSTTALRAAGRSGAALGRLTIFSKKFVYQDCNAAELFEQFRIRYATNSTLNFFEVLKVGY